MELWGTIDTMVILKVVNGKYGYLIHQVQGEEIDIPNVYYETFDEAYDVLVSLMMVENEGIIIEGEI